MHRSTKSGKENVQTENEEESTDVIDQMVNGYAMTTPGQNKNTKTNGASPLSGSLNPHGTGSLILNKKFEDAASNLGIETISNTDPDVKSAIIDLSNVFDSINSNTPIDAQFKHPITPSNLAGSLAKLGSFTRGSEDSVYHTERGLTLRVSNHSTHANFYKTSGENISILIKERGINPGTFVDDNQTKIIEFKC